MNNTLSQLKQWTHIVADTGNLKEIIQFKPEEATTNPTLILKAFQESCDPIEEAYRFAQQQGAQSPTLQNVWMACSVVMGEKILKHIPGRLSIEVDARLSFDTEATVNNALTLIQAFKTKAIDPKRLLIKIAATWEGIQAAKILEKQGIACNVTLIFNLVQALACAQSDVTLISPFVGRIYDWYKAKNLLDTLPEDPGVNSVKTIFKTLKSQGYTTEIMGASFRTLEQVIALAGCDRLTISTKLLEALSKSEETITQQLVPTEITSPTLAISEKEFRWQLNADPMATEKLAEGIRLFAKDSGTLEQLIADYLTQKSLPFEA